MSKKHEKISGAIIVIVVLALSVLALVYGRTKSEGRATDATRNSSTTTSTLQGTALDDRIEAELITVRPTGFEPNEISRPAGKFLLAIDNRSGLQEIALRIGIAGITVQRLQIPRNKIDWRTVVDLSPGTYVLREANHPEWMCRITVNAL